jgi:CheY-like chemotaxis protein/anti-sigma regulatory factor (Ser/Thr protein kinase)
VVERVRQSLDVLSKLFDSLLDLTLLDTGQVEVKSQTFAVARVLEEVGDDFASVAAACGVELRVARTRLCVRSDPVIVRRIVQNLLSNAIRHADRGVVVMGGRRVGAAVAIDVIDTGPGIPPEDQTRIFEEFTKLERDARMDAQVGLGLGLAIVQRMATILGLEVAVASRLGRGSRFRVAGLEVAAEETAADPTTAAEATADAVEAKRIAVFDDDADTLRATGDLLRKWGFAVELHAGWPAVLDATPDVLVCDYQLGRDATGLDVVRDVRASTGRDVPALIVTGADVARLRAAAVELPILSKPVRPAQLRSALLAALAGAH